MKNLLSALIAASVSLGILISANPALSQSPQQTNFSISPPPLGYPDFSEENVLYNKIDVSYISLSGKYADFKGFGMNYTPHYSIPPVAFDCLLGIYSISGTAGTGSYKMDLSFVGMNIVPAVEFLAVNLDDFKAILFAGYDFSVNRGSYVIKNFTFDGTNYYDVTVYLDTVLHGPAAGIQAHLGMGGGMLFSPFFMIKKTSGALTTTADPNFVFFNNEYKIPSFTTISYGFDIIHEPSGVSLSGILQASQKSGDSDEMKSVIISLSYSFK